MAPDVLLPAAASATARRIGLGLAYVLAAVVVLVWPSITLTVFLAVGAVILVVVGIVNLADAVRVLRTLRTTTA